MVNSHSAGSRDDYCHDDCDFRSCGFQLRSDVSAPALLHTPRIVIPYRPRRVLSTILLEDST
jgi:hypothetical protein